MRDSIRNRSMRLPRPSPYRSLTLVLVLFVLTILLYSLDQAGQLGPLRSQAQTVLVPALGGLHRLGESVSGIGQGLTEVQQLRERNKQLEQEISQLKDENIQSKAQQQEYERLRQQLRMEQEQPWKTVGANVAAHTPDGGRHTLTLMVGSDKGVKSGMAVIGQEGTSPHTLIGVVEEVSPRSSSILLITDYSSVISARIYHGSNIADGVVQGQWQRGSRLELQQVEREAQIAPGDEVMTAGLTEQSKIDLPLAAIPHSIPIGTIETVHTDGHNQVADVRPYLDPDQVHYAWVILSHDE